MQRLLFRQFAWIYRVNQWFNRRLSPLGHFLSGLLLVSAAFGANTRATTTYQLFALLSGLFASGWAWACLIGKTQPQIAMARRLPRYALCGEVLRYPVTLINSGGKTERGLSLMDQLQVQFPDWGEFRGTPEAGKIRRNRFDRYVGFPRWQRWVRWRRGAGLREHALPELPPHQAITVELELLPLRRGRLQFVEACLFQPDPFGLTRKVFRLGLSASCCVLPQSYPVSPLPPAGGRVYQRGGVALANAVGDSAEFLSLREFRQGDQPRNIHWRSSAKLGRWVVKEFQDEYFIRRALVLDTFAAPGQAVEFEAAVSVAASLANAESPRDSLLDLLFVGQQAHCFTSGRGLADSEALLEVLAGVGPARPADFTLLAQSVLRRADSLSSVVCVWLAWDEARLAFARALQAFGIPVVMLLVSEQAPRLAQPHDLFFRRLRPSHLAEDLLWR